ncbi:MAG TPA: arsenate reductase ArsC [Burkholderiales bacterium]
MKRYHVLFLCTANSARSILAEAYLNHVGRERFRAYSAGSRPAGKVNRLALELLRESGIPTAGLRSKSWQEFTWSGAPEFDFVLTVCGAAAGELCPVWPGRPATAHWGVADPAATTGSDKEKRDAFRLAFAELSDRIDRLVALPLDTLSAWELPYRLQAISGAATPPTPRRSSGRAARRP